MFEANYNMIIYSIKQIKISRIGLKIEQQRLLPVYQLNSYTIKILVTLFHKIFISFWDASMPASVFSMLLFP